jgi:hypothetical protein
MKTVRVKADRTKDFARHVTALTKTRVLVGVPSDDDQPHRGPGQIDPNERKDAGPLNNATLAAIHDRGAPEANIPARPFMVPGMDRSLASVQAQLVRAGKAALAGDVKGMDQGLVGAGLKAVDGIRMTIQEGIPPPLSQVTIDRRRQRTKGSSYRREAKSPEDVKPLIDTGQLLHSISFIVRKIK